jgi:hypothetical protein
VLPAWVLLPFWLGGPCAAADAPSPRRIVSLNGTWELGEGSLDERPREFDRRVPVPGLADMARPAPAEVGTAHSGRYRRAFWYRRQFALEGPVPAVARLKIHKAQYGTKVWLNGTLAGEHLPCFTPAEFDVRRLLKGPGQCNELVIRVGAHRDVLPKGMPDGFDFEKIHYIPGIYDDVELILSGTPRVASVQAVPNLPAQAVEAVAVIDGPFPATDCLVTCRVREAATGSLAGQSQLPLPGGAANRRVVKIGVPIRDCRCWSPEDPFLYELEVSTGADALRTRFGMRSFRFDPKTGRAVLNGKPYFLRGTNVCAYRFFEDPQRGDRPWRREWVRRLHRVFRSMHWNAIRYCIGFPPELWYEVADEEGLMIQDEFPVWQGDRWPAELKSTALVREYTEWMRERWNHPSVVLWDAQNESVTTETAKAIAAVRHLDLSDRPWDNGYGQPGRPGDSYEAHPYAFYNPAFSLSAFATLPGAPGVPGGLGGNVFLNTARNPVIINEYGWLWLNRDGTPTTLSKKVYERLVGPNASGDERREVYARLLAAKTEFWRARRQVAGVLHFCGLGYSRPDGQTSDHFLDIESLRLDPHFREHVGDAFSPVGLLVDHWAEDVPPGRTRQVPVVVINDLDKDWEGAVRLQLKAADWKIDLGLEICREERGDTVRFTNIDQVIVKGRVVSDQSQPCRVAALGTRTLSFEVKVPAAAGRYQLVGELVAPGGHAVRSLRDFAVLSEAQRIAKQGLAQGRPATASSSVTVGGEHFPAAAAVDGNPSTRWSSEFSDPQWIAVDLGAPKKISRVELVWEAAYGKAYAIQVSLDGTTWKDVYATRSGQGGVETARFAPAEARWVRLYGTRRGTPFGYSLWEFKVFP